MSTKQANGLLSDHEERMKQTLFHVTVLSNFARGFDKYTRRYSKEGIPESTYPDRFFLLRRDELGIGIQKATGLQKKLGAEGNRLVVLETEVDGATLQPNSPTGRGQFIQSDHITLTGLHELEHGDSVAASMREVTVEEVMAASLQLLNPKLIPFEEIHPRAVSFLPVALACQAKCPFCFSKASVSAEQPAAKPDWGMIRAWLNRARSSGAERAVITGGGEPTLLPEQVLLQLIAACAGDFEKVVLITNGYTIAGASGSDQVDRLRALRDVGLRVLAISRHHHETDQSQRLMNLNIPLETLIRTWREHRDRWPNLRLRLICVIQKGGVEDAQSVDNYLSWAANEGVEEVCFKELYVSTSAESVYHDRSANDWSRRNQVPLSLITDFAERQGFVVESRLPWGAPVYAGNWRGKPLRIAAYTEPSLFWERTHGIARSWNIMADGRCNVSLEDRASEIKLEKSA
jgi:molybdenum cofactor biosynthesis enzyme MoaA